MNSKIKMAKIGCIISSIGILTSTISMFINEFNTYHIILFCCMLGVFCSNFTIYLVNKKKEKISNDDKEK